MYCQLPPGMLYSDMQCLRGGYKLPCPGCPKGGPGVRGTTMLHIIIIIIIIIITYILTYFLTYLITYVPT